MRPAHRLLRTVVCIALSLVCALGPALAIAAGPTAAEPGVISVAKVDTEDYPDVELVLGLPTAFTEGSADPTFLVTENGRNATVLSAEDLTGESTPIDVVLVIDTSGSMKGESLAAAKRAAASFAEAFDGGGRIAVISFSTRPRIVVPFTTDDAAIIAGVNSLEASGETALYDAMSLAAKLATDDGEGSGAVVLLSDGGDTMSRSTLDDAVNRLRSAGISVSTVALPSKEANHPALRTVASQTGGRATSVKAIADLPALYTDLAEELQQSWSVVYRSNRPSTKDLEIQIEVTTKDVKASALQVVPNPRFKETRATTAETLSMVPANMLTLATAVVLVALAAALGVAGIMLLVLRPRAALSQLEYYEQFKGISYDPTSEAEDGSAVGKRVLGAVEYVAGNRGFTAELRQRLERAGMPLRPVEYISAHLMIVVVAGVLVQLLTQLYLVSLFAVVFAAFAPIFYIDYRIAKRTRAFGEQLPDLLSLIAGSLRAGWGMMQAIDLVVDQAGSPTQEEFRRVQTEARLGLPVEVAMANMAERVDSDDFRWAVSAIAIQREVGGNLAEVLDVVAETVRERGTLRRQIAALTAEGRLSAIILIALPFLEAAVLAVINPTYVRLMVATPMGVSLTMVGVLLLIVGSVWLRKAMSVEV